MKLNKLVTTLGLAAVLAAGVGIATISNSSAKNAEAAESTRIYITNNYGCTNLRVHYWGSSNATENMTWAYKNDGSQDVYYCDLPSGTDGWQFIGYYGSWYRDTYSLDQTVPANNHTGWYIEDTSGDGGSKFYMKTWDVTFFTVSFDANGGSGSMTDQSCFCKANEGNNLTSNAFTRYGYTFAGWNTNADGTGTGYGNNAHINNETSGASVTLYAQWTHAEGRYIVGDFGSCSWGIEGAIYLEPKNSQYEGQVYLEFGDTFKIAYYNGSSLSSYFGYSWIRSGCGAYHYFSGSGDSDIECYARGTYSFYFRDVEYETGKKISVELNGDLNAEHLAAQLMGFAESEGHCGDTDRFPAMKTIYLGLDSSEQTVFQSYGSLTAGQFRNAYDRYTAWARALGENPWATGKALKANILLGNTFENSSATLIIVIVSTLAVAAIGGYFFIRRKHEK